MDLAEKPPLKALEKSVSEFPDFIVYGSVYPYMMTRYIELSEEGDLLSEPEPKIKESLRQNADILG